MDGAARPARGPGNRKPPAWQARHQGVGVDQAGAAELCLPHFLQSALLTPPDTLRVNGVSVFSLPYPGMEF